ncbi:murein biosynthesis integral membrane protein MurJ [Beggiatoa leptomitoformis]|uniref:Probable lipid II flippase MurJ n=1 Tax=Beggiatoa leptomitoformis TaxID=288004 RepID=A0A2N9YJ39_9GAMM|nr:murein biosynthesis integral membrane protein MurJ [Beggiatoa leptomitoformis]AUI70542.1 murein biosynthesis integral membrane protein MurJ [Beggiatoa leptomitoformis]
MLSKKLLKSTAMVGGLTLVSRLLGFVRDMVIAHAFGAGASTDAFLVAFKIPNFMRRLFAEGAFSQAFVPILSEYKTQREALAVKLLINHVAGTLGFVLFFVTLLGIIGAPALVALFAPGFWDETEKYALTVDMLRITFPYLFFIALTAFAGSVLNTFGRFAIPAFTPVLLNLCMIIATLCFTGLFAQPIMALAWGVLFAGIAQFLFQIPFLRKIDMLPHPQLAWHDEGVRRILGLMLPALFGVSVTQINLLVDTLMASFLVSGSVSWLYYADRLMEFPVGVFGLALATVMLPNLSKTIAKGDTQGYNAMLNWSMRWVFLIATPAMVGLIVLAQPMLTALFRYGEFSTHDVLMTSYSLMTYSVGLVGFVMIKVLASGFYARQDTRTPVRIGVISMLTNIVLNIIFILPLQHAGLALSTAIAALVNAYLLYRGLQQQGILQLQAETKIFLQRIILANLVMGLLLWLNIGNVAEWAVLPSYSRLLHLLGWITIGMVIYAATLLASGLRLHHFSLHSDDL